MKIALVQQNLTIGDFPEIILSSVQAINQARAEGASLIVFPELSVCGYPAADMLNQQGFVDACMHAVDQIAAHCRGIVAVVGGPYRRHDNPGKSLYNSAYVLEDGGVSGVVHKALLPTYDVFDEYRYFEPADSFSVVMIGGKRVAITICEDIWDIGPRRMYKTSPMDALIRQHPDFMINLSASPFAWNRGVERLNMLRTNALRYKIPLFYVNQLGCQTDLIFDGGSAVFNARGELTDLFPPFIEDVRMYDLDEVLSAKGKAVEDPFYPKNKFLYDALVFGLADYFRKSGIRGAVLGLSGGIDSAVTLCVAVEALGAQNIHALLLPGPYSSDHSVGDARLLAERLGVAYNIISISKTHDVLLETLGPLMNHSVEGVTEENLQARARGVILMGFSNRYGHMLLNTSNKSEAAVGYGTLYGDMCGGLSVLGDVYKTEVYDLAQYINRFEEIIPLNTITKPPSAELRPDQKDTDSLPEYEVLDQILFQYIEKECSIAQIQSMGFDPEMVRQVVKMVNANEYKRRQSPPSLRVSQKGFGSGRRLPIVARYL